MPFYHELILKSKDSTVEIFKIAGKFEDPKQLNRSNSLGTAPLSGGLSMSIGINWTEGSNAANFLAGALAGTLNATQSLARNIKTSLAGIRTLRSAMGNLSDGSSGPISKVMAAGSEIAGWTAQQIDSLPGISALKTKQGVLITGAEYMKQYTGSQHGINLPQVNIMLMNTTDTSEIYNRAERILFFLAPLAAGDEDNPPVGVDKSEANYQRGDTTLQQDAANAAKTYFRYDRPPLDYTSNFVGFNPDELQGTFVLRIGHRYVPYCLPTNINVEVSQSGCYLDSGNGQGEDSTTSKNWVPHYIRISASFDLATRYMTRDFRRLLRENEAIKMGAI